MSRFQLLAGAVLAIGTAVEPWLAAAIVGVLLLATAGLLSLLGKRQIDDATPPKPEQAMESIERDVDEVKERVRR